MTFEDIYLLFFHPGEVTEIRSFGVRGKGKAWSGFATGSGVFGYFDNPGDFATAATGLEAAKAPGIYFVINPVNPDLLARAANRLKAAGPKDVMTTDKDILELRWLLIDLDPKRPTNISSTDEELAAARQLGGQIYREMEEEHGAVGIPAYSGNGVHLLYRLPGMENTDENRDRVKAALGYLSDRYSNDQVDLDKKVYNPSRIWKLYGTTARKGDHIPTRPHRQSYISSNAMTLETDGASEAA